MSIYLLNTFLGCDLLGDYLTQIKEDYRRAAKVYKENCDKNNFARSCTKIGEFLYSGKGMNKWVQKIFLQ